jgi:hypothetical protein
VPVPNTPAAFIVKSVEVEKRQAIYNDRSDEGGGARDSCALPHRRGMKKVQRLIRRVWGDFAGQRGGGFSRWAM